MYKLNSMTKEQHLKEDKIDDMFLTENIKENIKMKENRCAAYVMF